MSIRHDGRAADELRPLSVNRDFPSAAPGRVLISAGDTTILCTASIDESVPPWKMNSENPTGWVTAEYNMLPGCTSPRKSRRVDGRATEIQRLIGRSLRSVVDFEALGPRTVTVDCDVVRADGGTRTLSITGGFIALVDALQALPSGTIDLQRVLLDSVAAVSTGVVAGEAVLDLDYVEDSSAEVDSNLVMTGRGLFVEVQGTAEGRPFSAEHLNEQLRLGKLGIERLTALQREILGKNWPLDTMDSSC
ncbi:Ribonuclease PH (RNase PH) (tRNA nucleotidyltransferase) [Durusdinium trenchii]|uniref:Ribonuclease PH (RNase PH) (tRNA nucleotidyltransferase) n=1 Tax=Durusdinium trenchii TaxID=1381693 RepID=A0ABP0JDE7_9DINO